MSITKSYLNVLIYKVNGAAIDVHKALGPGLLESVYHKCMKHELYLRKINFTLELFVPVSYKDLDLDVSLRCDLFIKDILVVELMAIDGILPNMKHNY